MQRMTFHHIGIPTSEQLPDSDYSEALKFHASGYFESPYAIEWMHFDDDNALPDIIKRIPHVAFVVDDLEAAIEGKNIVLAPESPCDGVTVAFILDGRNLIELMHFDKPEQDVWPHPDKFMI
ncbi:Uncharacterised protein [BD1-7 clade bacterium]|uniref:VOC domain-containing protein n=1 Tax=BD1-7 clade bacterium TaxID=2029982 RepID=A0A5S9PG73_9GAMM|nr:Uncharacterised protein [BD1-7 clade bacterium]